MTAAGVMDKSPTLSSARIISVALRSASRVLKIGTEKRRDECKHASEITAGQYFSSSSYVTRYTLYSTRPGAIRPSATKIVWLTHA
jgi:hypothetical protein